MTATTILRVGRRARPADLSFRSVEGHPGLVRVTIADGRGRICRGVVRLGTIRAAVDVWEARLRRTQAPAATSRGRISSYVGGSGFRAAPRSSSTTEVVARL
jgi:hypothetical protein